MIKVFVSALLFLIAADTVAGNMYIYKDKDRQVLLTKVNPSSNSYKLTHKTDAHIDSEITVAKKSLMKARKQLAEQHLKNVQIDREKGIRVSDTDEIVYKVGDTSKKDVGAKIGMTTDQVLNETYWGLEKPDYVHKVDDKYGELEQRYYNNDGALYFDNGRLRSIQIFR